MVSCYCKLFKHLEVIVDSKVLQVDNIYQGEF